MIDDWMPAFAKPSKHDSELGDPLKLPHNALGLDGLQAIYRNPALPLQTRFRAMVAALPFESPKLMATAIIHEQDFATLLDRRLARMAEQKLIEARPTSDKIIEGKPVDARLPPPIPDRRFRRI